MKFQKFLQNRYDSSIRKFINYYGKYSKLYSVSVNFSAFVNLPKKRKYSIFIEDNKVFKLHVCNYQYINIFQVLCCTKYYLFFFVLKHK